MRTLDVYLAMRICGDNGISRDSLDVCLVINLRVPPMNLCIGVGTRSCPQILEVTMEYLGDIRVLVDLCLNVLF